MRTLLATDTLEALAASFDATRERVNNALARVRWAEACRVASAPGSAALFSTIQQHVGE